MEDQNLVNTNKKEEVVNTIGTTIAKFEGLVEERQIVTDADLGVASDMLKDIKTLKKQIDDKRKEFTAPLNSALKKLNAEFKPHISAAEKIQRELEKKIVAYQREQERLREEAERKRREEQRKRLEEEQKRREELAEKNGSEKELDRAIALEDRAKEIDQEPIQFEPKAIKSQAATTSIRKAWTYQVTDENAVPREYCAPDPRKLANAVKSGVREIAGVNIFEKSIVATR
jgi:hypothetical protein